MKGLRGWLRRQLWTARTFGLRTSIFLCDQIFLHLLSPSSDRSGVVVVKLDAIGDFVVWLGAARELKALFSQEKVTLYANAAWAELARLLPYWDEVVAVDMTRLNRLSLDRFRFFKALRLRRFKIALQPTYSRSPTRGDALVAASGATERIGWSGDFNNMNRFEKPIADSGYTRLLSSGVAAQPEIERNAEFVRLLGRASFATTGPFIPKLLDLPDSLKVLGAYLIIFPGASMEFRQWPAKRFADVANELSSEFNLTSVVCGSAAERALCEEVITGITGKSVNLAGKTSLPEFVELVRGARLLIGNETSAVHFAAATRTPSVCVLGGGHYGRFVPYPDDLGCEGAPHAALHRMPCFGCDWHCSRPEWKGQGPMPCISGIAKTQVSAIGRQLLVAQGAT